MTSQITNLTVVCSTICSGGNKKTWKFRYTGICAGNSPVTVKFPAQKASNGEYGSISWRHHVINRHRRNKLTYITVTLIVVLIIQVFSFSTEIPRGANQITVAEGQRLSNAFSQSEIDTKLIRKFSLITSIEYWPWKCYGIWRDPIGRFE